MKMTKIFAMALVALSIVSCSKEEIGGSNNGTNGEEINTPTYATFKFNIGRPSSRAATDFNPIAKPEADVADATIGRMQLLIFNAATQGLELNEILDSKTTTKTVLLTAGRKKIFFVANSDNLTAYNTAINPTDFAPGVKTLTDFYALNFSAGTPQQTTVDKTTTGRLFDLSPLYKLSNETSGSELGLPMSNTNGITYTLAAGVSETEASNGSATADGTSTTNTFEMQLYYMIAKARLVLAAGVENTTDDIKPVIKDVKYSIRNLARATNYIQNVPTAGNPQSYYYSTKFAATADLGNGVVAFNDEFDNASNINVAATETPGDYLYVPENNHSMLVRGQSSYFAIKATFEPVVISAVAYDVNAKVAYTTATLASTNVDAKQRKYIYTTNDVQGIAAGAYFLNLKLLQEAAWMMKNGLPFAEANREDAEGLVAAADYMSFTGGESYYRVDLGDGAGGAETQYGVLRSNKYDAKINSITGPGVPSEGELITDPTNPVSARTYISATIKAAKWNTITQSADL